MLVKAFIILKVLFGNDPKFFVYLILFRLVQGPNLWLLSLLIYLSAYEPIQVGLDIVMAKLLLYVCFS